MAGVDVVAEGLVGEEGGVGVGHEMYVAGTAGIVTGKDGLEGGYAVLVGGLDASEESIVDVGSVRGITVTVGNDTAIDTRSVAVPDLEIEVRDGLAGVNIDNLVVEKEVDTLLVLGEVFANVLATDIIGSLGDIGGQNARIIASKEGGSVGIGSVA